MRKISLVTTDKERVLRGVVIDQFIQVGRTFVRT